MADDVGPCLDGLVAVGGPDHVEIRDRPECGEVLDGLVGRAVLADADRVVGEHETDLGLGERRQADRRAHVVGEHEEGAADRQGAPVQRHADQRRTHRMLADAVVDVSPAAVFGRERGRPGQAGAVAAGEVGRTGDQAGEAVVGGVERLLDRLAGGERLAEVVGGQVGVPTVGAGHEPTPPATRVTR